jgi:DNA-binding transcriptional LysR family regulator
VLNHIDLSRTDLNLLVLFGVVMETRHVGRAAERLNLTPSAVSHGLGRLRTLLADPLFLRTPKGVEPTDRALQLSPAIAGILAQIRGVVESAEPFDPARSTRRFTIGAPDGVSAVFLPALMDQLRLSSPGIDIGVRQVLPKLGELSPDLAWRNVLSDLETRLMDVAIIPTGNVPPRFGTHLLYEEDFVIAMRAGHRFAREPSLKRYCAQRHLVVSETGDPSGFVDKALAERRLSRRIALTVPNFMFALAVLGESDLISALPRRLVALHGARFGLVCTDAPIKLPQFKLHLVTPKVAMQDGGLAWLVAQLRQTNGERVQSALGSRSRRQRG